MIYWQLLVNLKKPMRFVPEVDSWMQSVSGIFSIYFATFCHFPHLLNSFSNFESSQSNFLAEETAALHWNVGVFPATSTWENLAKILTEQLVGIKTHNNIQRQKTDRKLTEINSSTFSEGKFPLKNFGVSWIKICEMDEIRIGSGRDYKAWLINLFIHGFHKYMSVARKLIQTIFNHTRKILLWRAIKLIFDHTD